MKFLTHLEKQIKPSYALLIGFTLIGLIGLLDYLTGYELAFSAFYVLPIALITWLTNRTLGLVSSITSALVWFGADTATGHLYSNLFIPYWNTLIRLAFFTIITLLLSALRTSHQNQRELARIDNLTGAVNSRFFYDLAQMELDRFRRFGRPFTLAYLDIDNFKVVNDQFGHSTGDQVLRNVVSSIRGNLRKTDVVGRLGGDEFLLLLPGTDQEPAKAALSKIQSALSEKMQDNNWPITFSIGVVTCLAAPEKVEELVRMADELMYSAKRKGKNSIEFSTYSN